MAIRAATSVNPLSILIPFMAVLSIADGGIWQEAKIPPYKHAIAVYGVTIAGLPSQIAYGSWQKICHAIPPWRSWCHHLTTLSIGQSL
ncbi:hypothetical protein E2542_SST28349 [Spatholobus suberectus]|nr:hypothetical protein E2542_SST28349 [Spatholobus suberectus]